jgi:hypothetical protein
MHDLKSIRIITRDNKPSRINTSENYRWKSLRINTSKNTPGGGGDAPGRTGEPAASAPRNATASA